MASVLINRLRDRVGGKIRGSAGESVGIEGRVRSIDGRKFEQRAPRRQNEIDIFAGRWASDLSEIAPGTVSGAVPHFAADMRPREAMQALAPDVPAAQLRILELGPLEGGHTYQFEKMGVGEIVAVEANVEAYLKCLIVQNIANLRNARFLFGDIVALLKEDTRRYDFIFCCGVLYHMSDPLQLIKLMSTHTDRVYLWTHYHTPESRPGLQPLRVTHDGETYVYHRAIYTERTAGRFWGGNAPTASFLSRDDIVRAFRQHGLSDVVLHGEELSHPGGPCFSASFRRS